MKIYKFKHNARTITRVTHGFVVDDKGTMQKTLVYARITHDDNGATISLSDDKSTMLIIPLEPLSDVLELKGEIA